MNPRTCLHKINGKEICFLHVPKTGGQSVEKSIKMGLRRHLPVTDPLRKTEVLHCDYAFAYVRNPYSWATSLFYWFSQLHEKPNKRRPENAALNQWCRNTDVNTFWRQVDVPYLNRHTSGNMFRPQSWFLMRGDGAIHPRIDVLRFEDFANEWKKVEAAVGTTIKLPHINKSKHKAPRYELTEATKKTIDRLYAIDFANFYPDDRN